MRELRVAPSLLAADFARLGEELRRAEDAGADWHHVDVMDGHFVPNLTIGPPVVAAVRAASALPLDVHLMIEDPARWAPAYAEAGADVLTVHQEAVGNDLPAAIETVRDAGCRVGVAVNPPAPVEPLRPHLDAIDLVLVMTVPAGFGGQPFQAEALDKVRRLRDWGFEGDVEVDGGVSDKTVTACARAGANVFVAGTYLYRADDMGEALARLRRAAEDAAAVS